MSIFKRIYKKISGYLLPANKPDFLIVGAQKAGTTSLHFYLNQHPMLVGSIPKEVGYFNRDDNYIKGKRWYHKAFRDETGKRSRSRLYYEATPEYLYKPYAAKRIFQYNKNLKIIILLREPVKRAYSAWNMYRDFQHNGNRIPDILTKGYLHGRENNLMKELYSTGNFPPFKDCIQLELDKISSNSQLEEPSFLRRGLYYEQIKRYTEYFGRKNVKIIGFKDIVGDRKTETLNDILNFLKLPSSNWNFLKDEKLNSRTYPEVLDEQVRIELSEFYEPHNKKLFEFLGDKPNW